MPPSGTTTVSDSTFFLTCSLAQQRCVQNSSLQRMKEDSNLLQNDLLQSHPPQGQQQTPWAPPWQNDLLHPTPLQSTSAVVLVQLGDILDRGANRYLILLRSLDAQTKIEGGVVFQVHLMSAYTFLNTWMGIKETVKIHLLGGSVLLKSGKQTEDF